MNRGPYLFLCALCVMASSFWGLVLMPQLKLGKQDMVALSETGELYPAKRPGLATEGADVYRSLGCIECHTQQVRPRGYGSDFDRGWGMRFSVFQDYLRDDPVQLGNLRLGPDLANIGGRQTNTAWHYLHLYDPRLTSPGSLMPRYPYLFDVKIVPEGAAPPAGSIPLNQGNAVLAPKRDAEQLVAYLLSLRSLPGLYEAPMPAKKAAGGAQTNAPAGGGAGVTNAPAPGASPASNAPASTQVPFPESSQSNNPAVAPQIPQIKPPAQPAGPPAQGSPAPAK